MILFLQHPFVLSLINASVLHWQRVSSYDSTGPVNKRWQSAVVKGLFVIVEDPAYSINCTPKRSEIKTKAQIYINYFI